MEEVMQQVDVIKERLDRSLLMHELKEARQKIEKDEHLKQLIDSFHQNPYQESLKEEIYQNTNFMAYQHLENELYFLILEINQRLKTLTEEKSCRI